MTARRADLVGLPYWPRLMSAEQAAAYLGISQPTFVERVRIAPCKIGSRALFDRAALDRWVDGLAAEGKPTGFAARIEEAHGGGDDADQGR